MNILVVDDEEVLQDVLGTLLRKEGFRPFAARTGEEALMLLEREPIDLVLLDLMLPGMSGMEVLKQIRGRDPEQVVVVVTAFSSIESAIQAMRQGAFHYIPKPFKNEEVLLTVRKGLEQKRLAVENRTLKQELEKRYGLDNLIGKSAPMQQIFDLIRLAAPSKSNMLILGESGTGKELVAKALHHHSRRTSGPFVTVNSGSMPHDLLESTLFGHVKGAFTGAVAAKKGLFEAANNGSIFFDEIGNIPLETQAKLLRVMQEREFMRLGGTDTVKVDVRLVAATNIDLRRAVEEGRFREDLYYRLNVIAVQLPALRHRKEDVPALVAHFVDKYARENDKPVRGVTPDGLQALMDYDWPGNVRELENVIERGVVLTTGTEITRELIPDHVKSAPTFQVPHVSVPPEGINLRDVVSGFERRIIESTLETTGGVQKEAARLLGLKPTTLNEMIKRYNILLPRDRRAREVEEATEKPGVI